MELRLCGLLVALSLLKAVRGLTITVNTANGSQLIKYNNDNAAFQGRSYSFPDDEANRLKGHLVLPGGDPCNSVPAVLTNLSLIAYVELGIHTDCLQELEVEIFDAGYMAMLVYSPYKDSILNSRTDLPQGMFSNTTFRYYLRDILTANYTYNETIFVDIWDDANAKLERLFIIFGCILLIAVALAVIIFCSTFIVRFLVHKWRTRGLTRWQIRRLPSRKYRKSRETTEMCSICLEDFKEGQTIRVLPCDHVFHPKCVDEWLQKWNRTCPLCKATIKRRGGASNVDPDETSGLLSEEGASSARASFNEEPPSSYGATDTSPLLAERQRSLSPSSVELSQPASSPGPPQYLTPGVASEGETLSFQTADEALSTNTQEGASQS